MRENQAQFSVGGKLLESHVFLWGLAAQSGKQQFESTSIYRGRKIIGRRSGEVLWQSWQPAHLQIVFSLFECYVVKELSGSFQYVTLTERLLAFFPERAAEVKMN